MIRRQPTLGWARTGRTVPRDTDPPAASGQTTGGQILCPASRRALSDVQELLDQFVLIRQLLHGFGSAGAIMPRDSLQNLRVPIQIRA